MALSLYRPSCANAVRAGSGVEERIEVGISLSTAGEGLRRAALVIPKSSNLGEDEPVRMCTHIDGRRQ